MSYKPTDLTFYGTLIYETGFRDTAAYLIAGFRDSAEVLRQRKVFRLASTPAELRSVESRATSLPVFAQKALCPTQFHGKPCR